MIVLDTHALVWAVNGDERLGRKTKELISGTARTGRVAISAITPWEIALLVEKGRLGLANETQTWIEAALALPGIYLAPIEPAIAIDSVRLPGEFHADPADRLIIATARYHDAPLVTADRAILSYAASGPVEALDATT
ncbi:MAG: type II toxin-antitoxin system VapC family toxin [Gammaproteobacteria bacterium]|nr:type II toxin-antitoxin system VapC family toxin [Gammaproteobacteria bacterium]